MGEEMEVHSIQFSPKVSQIHTAYLISRNAKVLCLGGPSGFPSGTSHLKSRRESVEAAMVHFMLSSHKFRTIPSAIFQSLAMSF